MKNLRKAQFAKSARSEEETAFLKTICPDYTDRPKLKHMQTVLRWLRTNPQAVQAFRSVLEKLDGVSALHTSCLVHYALKQGAAASVAQVLASLKFPAQYHFKFLSYRAFAKNYLTYLWVCTEATSRGGSLWTVPDPFTETPLNAGIHLKMLVPVVKALETVLSSGIVCIGESKTDLCLQICHFLMTDLADTLKTFAHLTETAKADLLNYSLKEVKAVNRSLTTAGQWMTTFPPLIKKLKQVGVNTPTLQWIQDSPSDQALRKEVIHQIRHAEKINEAINDNKAQKDNRKKQQRQLAEEQRQLQQERENKAIFDCLADLQIHPAQSSPVKPAPQPEPAVFNQPNFVQIGFTPQLSFPAMQFYSGQMNYYTGQMPYPQMVFGTGPVQYSSVQAPSLMQPQAPAQVRRHQADPFDGLL